MPQIKAEHRGAMVNFMNARGIAHQEETVPAASLKPTQAEFSREKVKRLWATRAATAPFWFPKTAMCWTATTSGWQRASRART
jgi:hypothetical protein